MSSMAFPLTAIDSAPPRRDGRDAQRGKLPSEPTSESDPRPPPRGRRSECEALDRLLEGVRAGQSRVLVLRGEAGVGKLALLEYLLACASGCRIAPAAGVEAEMALSFAGLHQLCVRLLDNRVARLADPQSDALQTAFGLSTGEPPDRVQVGLAVLSLLAEMAEDKPLICVIDDAQWLDRISAQTLAFVARVCWRSGLRWSSPCASPATDSSSRDCRSSWCGGWPTVMLVPCWMRV
jgi:AAA ATPase domain